MSTEANDLRDTVPVKLVLVVDDDEDDFEVFRQGLKEIAPELKTVLLTKSDSVLSYVDSLPDKQVPCLIVTDLNLPPTDGFEVILRLKEDPRYACIPVVVYSNSVNPKDVKKSIDLGACSFVHKAASVTQMHEDINKMVKYCLVT